jgi:hypothetical protein
MRTRIMGKMRFTYVSCGKYCDNKNIDATFIYDGIRLLCIIFNRY